MNLLVTFAQDNQNWIEVQGIKVLWKECKLNVSEIVVLSSLSFTECVHACHFRPACESLSYNRRFHVCSFYTADVTGYILAQHGQRQRTCAYVRREGNGTGDNINNTSGSFSCDLCEVGQTCDIQQETCSFLECGLHYSNATFLGNKNHVGAIKRIVCEPGFIEENFESAVICDSNGHWNYTPNCIPDVIPCPTGYGQWLHRPGHPIFQISFAQIKLKQTQAQASCMQQNASLVKIDALWKLEFVQFIVTQCKQFDNHNWIDGWYDWNTSTWLFTDGSPMPQGDVYWNRDRPINDVETCVKVQLDGLFRNQDCNDKSNFICERSNTQG